MREDNMLPKIMTYTKTREMKHFQEINSMISRLFQFEKLTPNRQNNACIVTEEQDQKSKIQ